MPDAAPPGNADYPSAHRFQVRSPVLPDLIAPAPTIKDEVPYVSQPWLDPRMLDDPVGRDLFVMAGCELTNSLHRVLFGLSLRYLWRNGDLKALWWPEVLHPIASIEARAPAAHFASLIWHCLRGTPWSRPYWDRVVAGMRQTLIGPFFRGTFSAMMQRWSRDDRTGWEPIWGE